MKLVWRVVIASSLSIFFLTSVATAAPGPVERVTTHSRIKVSDTSIGKGDDLFIAGRIKAGKNACRINQSMTLWFNGQQVGGKRTNNNGKVFFKRNPNHTGKWQVRFAGDKGGTHPHRFYCLPSASGKIKVNVS